MTHCNECGDLIPTRCYCHTCYLQLEAENARLRVALEHYAKIELYFPRLIVLECQKKGVRLAPIYSDFGDIARAALGEK